MTTTILINVMTAIVVINAIKAYFAVDEFLCAQYHGAYDPDRLTACLGGLGVYL